MIEKGVTTKNFQIKRLLMISWSIWYFNANSVSTAGEVRFIGKAGCFKEKKKSVPNL